MYHRESEGGTNLDEYDLNKYTCCLCFGIVFKPVQCDNC